MCKIVFTYRGLDGQGSVFGFQASGMPTMRNLFAVTFLALLLATPAFAEIDETRQAQADAEFHAQQAQNNARLQQEAVQGGYVHVVNNLTTGQTELYGTPEAIAGRAQHLQGDFVLPDGTLSSHPGGAAGALADHQRGAAEIQKVWDDAKKNAQGMVADDPNSPQAKQAVENMERIKQETAKEAKEQEERLKAATPKVLISYEKGKGADGQAP